MHCLTQLQRFFSVLLLSLFLLLGAAIEPFSSPAFATTGVSNEVSNVKGNSKDINGSYHRLQQATQASWDVFRDEKQAFSGNQSARQAAQPKQALKSINQNTKKAFQKTADSIKDGLSSR